MLRSSIQIREPPVTVATARTAGPVSWMHCVPGSSELHLPFVVSVPTDAPAASKNSSVPASLPDSPDRNTRTRLTVPLKVMLAGVPALTRYELEFDV